MRISIGIMLWNEAASIAATIDSIFNQTLLTHPNRDVESLDVVALANGCTDESIPNAETAFARNMESCPASYVTTRVLELPKGRQPAWNIFVHEYTADDTDYIIFMDADIIIIDESAFEKMASGPEKNPKPHVATSTAIKDIELRQSPSLFQWLTISMSNLERNARNFYVTGGLYCGRASYFRSLVFPRGFICGDDGFIGWMAATNLMMTDFDWDRVHQLDKPTFVFEAYSAPYLLFRQHRRRIIGHTVNLMIRDYISSRQTDKQPDAGVILRRECKNNPEWLNQYVAEQIQKRGFWVIPFSRVKDRFTQLRPLPLWKKVLKFPLASAGALWGLCNVASGNRMFKSGKYVAAWESLPNLRQLDEFATGSGSNNPAPQMQGNRQTASNFAGQTVEES